MLAHAGRPMAADDASILDANTCQLEAWAQRVDHQSEYWAAPACNFDNGWELALGLVQVHGADGQRASRLGLLQAKTVFRKQEPNGWGIGLVLAQQPVAAGSARGDTSVNFPLTQSLMGDIVLLHVNAGWLRHHATGRNDVTWAVGAEWAVQQRLALTLESYGSRHSQSRLQAGIRYSVVPGRADLDASYGERLTARGRERALSLGVTLVSGVLQ
jgi:hypothetical protein